MMMKDGRFKPARGPPPAADDVEACERLWALAKRRPLTPAENEELATARYGPRVGVAPVVSDDLDQYIEKTTHKTDLGLAKFVEGRFMKNAVTVSGLKSQWHDGKKRPCLFVRCRQHECEAGLLCNFKWKFVQSETEVVEFHKPLCTCPDETVCECGAHKPNASCAAIRLAHQQIAAEMAASPYSVATERKRRLLAGAETEDLPPSEWVYDRRTKSRSELRQHGGLSRTELDAALRALTSDREGAIFTFDERHSNIDADVAVLACDALLLEGVKFASRTPHGLRLACDATHDMGLQKWKLIAMGFLGVRRTKAGAWNVSLLPLGFCISKEENAPAVQGLIDSVTNRFRDVHDFDLKARTAFTYLDGGKALKKAFGDSFPEARAARCLQHIKKNVASTKSRSKWEGKMRAQQVKRWVGDSAYLPAHLFHLFWEGALEKLRELHEDKIVSYLEDEVLKRTEGKYDADWRTGFDSGLDAPFSTYSCNAIESFWRLRDQTEKDKPPRIDVMSDVMFFEETCKCWLKEKRWATLQGELRAGKSPDLMDPKFLRGGGAYAHRGSVAGIGKKQLRRFVFEGLHSLSKVVEVFFEHEEAGRKYWIAPKYNLNDFNKLTMIRFCRLMVAPPTLADLDNAGLVTGGKLDIEALLFFARKFTALSQDGDKLVETHEDFCERGQTEHLAWLQHKLEYAVWTSSKDTKPKRQLRAPTPKAAPKSKAKRTAKAKARRMAEASTARAPVASAAANVDGHPLPVSEHDLFGTDDEGEVATEAEQSTSEEEKACGASAGMVGEAWPQDRALAEENPEAEEDISSNEDALQPSVKIVDRQGEEVFSSFFPYGTPGEVVRARAADVLGVNSSDLALIDRARARFMQQGVFVDGDVTLCVVAVPRGG